MHFTLTAESDGTITVALGHDFTPAHVPQVIAAQRAALAAAAPPASLCSVCDHAAAVHDAVPADHRFVPAVTR